MLHIKVANEVLRADFAAINTPDTSAGETEITTKPGAVRMILNCELAMSRSLIGKPSSYLPAEAIGSRVSRRNSSRRWRVIRGSLSVRSVKHRPVRTEVEAFEPKVPVTQRKHGDTCGTNRDDPLWWQ